MLYIHLDRCTAATSKKEIIATHVKKKWWFPVLTYEIETSFLLEADLLGCNHRYKAQWNYQICLTTVLAWLYSSATQLEKAAVTPA